MRAPPEVDIGEYERRVLASLRVPSNLGIVDVWLEGEHPETQIVVVVQTSAAPAGRYVDRHYLWYAGSDSNPEMAAAAIVVSIMEASPGGMGYGRQPGWIHEPRPPQPGAVARRPDLDEPADTSACASAPAISSGLGDRPWPRPPEADPDLYERCLLSVFHGEWPGFRMHIEDAWLEHEYPDTMIVLALTSMAPDRLADPRRPGLPALRVIHRTEVWRKPPLPAGVQTHARSIGGIAEALIEWSYFAKRDRIPIKQLHEPRPSKPGATRRRPPIHERGHQQAR